MKYKKKGYISKDFYEIYLLTNAPFRVFWLLHHKIRVSPNEMRIKTYDVDFANWVSDIKKKTQNYKPKEIAI
jgi:hypothetical protein